MFMFFNPAIHFPTTIPMNISHFSSSSFSVSAFKADSRQEKELMKKVRKRERIWWKWHIKIWAWWRPVRTVKIMVQTSS